MARLAHTVPTDTAMDLLATPTRRSVVSRLIQSEGDTVTVDELVEYVAPENPPPEAARATNEDTLSLELQHVHLPKLEAADVVEVDARSGTVRYRPNERVEKLHRFVTSELD